MGLAGYVMPISAFVAGDYESAFEIACREMGMGNVPAARLSPSGVETIIPGRTLWGRFQLYSGIWKLRRKILRWKKARRRWQGLQYVDRLREGLRKELGQQFTWNEQGDSIAAHQIFRGTIPALQAYAWRQEFPKAFPPAEAGDSECADMEVRSSASQLGLSSARFPHLCEHSLWEGFFVPVRFGSPVELSDPPVSIGSSVCLLEELEELNEGLKIPARWDPQSFELPEPGVEGPFPAVTGWLLLEGFARASVTTDTPICLED